MHTHMLHCHFWDALNDISSCVQHHVVGAALPSDSALAAGKVSPVATGNLPAVPTLLAGTMPAGSVSVAAEVMLVVADDVPATSNDPSATAHLVLLLVSGAGFADT